MIRKIGLSLVALLLMAGGAQAQAPWPNKPVKILVPTAPGGTADALARQYAQHLGKVLGQQFYVENRGGAGNVLGIDSVVRSPADGYTLLLGAGTITINHLVTKKLPYDVLRDLTPVTQMISVPNVLVVNANSSYKTLMDLVKEGKAKPGSINWGHAGIGSGTHLNTERFIAASGIKVTQVPFKGTPEVFAAMFSGDVHAYWAPISAAMSSIKSGRLRPLAVSTAKRNATLPDVPTTGEAGVQGADSPLWFGVWGPAGMQPDVVNKINADVRKALQDPAVKDRLMNLGNDPMDMSPQEFARFVRSEIDVYQKVIKDAGIKPQ